MGLFSNQEHTSFRRINSGGVSMFVSDGGNRFTFSDINGLFVKDGCRKLFCCSVKTHVGTYQIFNLTEEEFWRIVEGWEFSVVCDETTRRITGSAGEKDMRATAETIFSMMDRGDQAGIEALTTASPCYQFEEISPE